MQTIPLQYGRHVFGINPAAYASARPGYPDVMYDRLIERCGPLQGASIFEVGAGTGLATGQLFNLGATHITAIEPNANLAAFLRAQIPGEELEIIQLPFEEAMLPEGGFTLGVAATSFHWVEQQAGLTKVFNTLAPGGWWAMWWNIFGLDAADDAFQAATDHLFTNAPTSPSQGDNKLPFALNKQGRLKDMELAGFTNLSADVWHWSLMYDTPGLINLYNTFSPIQALEPTEREHFFEQLTAIANKQFGGLVQRPFTTTLYMGQRIT
jgi:hypothetical protein